MAEKVSITSIVSTFQFLWLF